MTPPAAPAPAAPPAAIEVTDLQKSYLVGHIRQRRRPVLRGLSFRVERGEVFGYLGPNGAGKSTTLKVLMGLLRPDGGTATVLGRPLGDPAWKQGVGYLPEQPYFYDYLTAAEYVDFAGRLFGLARDVRRARTKDLLSQVGLAGAEGVALRRFSKGMLQRLGIAQALVNDPELVILDEPMSGLDPLGRRAVRDLILDLKARGKTVFFSTHILSDAETLCDRVALLKGGRLVAVGRLDEILKIDVSHMEVLVSGLGPEAVDRLPGDPQRRRAMGERWTLQVEERELGRVVKAVEDLGGRILSVQPVRQSLEDYFFKEMSDTADEGPWLAD